MHDVIQREIQSAGASIDAPSPDVGTIVAQGRNRQRVRRLGVLGAVAILVAVLATAGPYLLAERPGDKTRPADPGSSAWELVPPAPIAGRAQAAAVWTGEEFLVWGGHATKREFVDGAAYNPSTREWRAIPPAPLESSAARTAVWTGMELILWGGETEGSHARPDNGAAYNPATDSWRELPASPYWSLAGHSAVWTGNEMIVYGGVEGAASGGAIYDPATNDWGSLPDAPIKGRNAHAVVWTGSEMIVWGGKDVRGDALGDGAAFDPRSRSWRVLEDAPLEPRESPLAVWTGMQLVLWGGWSLDVSHPPGDATFDQFTDGAAYTPGTGTWEKLPPAQVGTGFPTVLGGWMDGRLVIVTGQGRGSAFLDLKGRDWHPLAEPPGRFEYGLYGSAVAVGDGSLLLWGGYRSEDDLRSDGFILNLS